MNGEIEDAIVVAQTVIAGFLLGFRLDAFPPVDAASIFAGIHRQADVLAATYFDGELTQGGLVWSGACHSV